MKLNISIKTPVLIQGALVIGLVPIDLFFGEVRLGYILPLYAVLGYATYLEVSKREEQEMAQPDTVCGAVGLAWPGPQFDHFVSGALYIAFFAFVGANGWVRPLKPYVIVYH